MTKVCVTVSARLSRTSSAGQPGMFGREEFEELAPVVDGFSLMTYDYSSGAK